jgi:hypothetical protein
MTEHKKGDRVEVPTSLFENRASLRTENQKPKTETAIILEKESVTYPNGMTENRYEVKSESTGKETVAYDESIYSVEE